MNTFPPKPGTVVYRVLAYLESKLPERPRATVGMACGDLRGLTPSQVREALEDAHAAGYVNREYDAGPGGRGPVFYELVRRTDGNLAVPPGRDRGADLGWLTGSGDPKHEPSGVIEPVVDPNPPVLEQHQPDTAISKVVAIRPTASGFDVELERAPELADWLASTRGLPPGQRDEPEAHVPGVAPALPQASELAAVAAAGPGPLSVQLDFASGPDQFAVALASDGRLHCWRGVVPYVFSRAEARALIDYLNRIDLEPLLEDEA